MLIVAAGAVASAGGQSAGAKDGYRAYAACGGKGKHPADFCFRGDHPVAVFRVRGEAEVPYRFCFRGAGERQRCRERKTRKPGQTSRTGFDIDGAGKYKLSWFADGRVVERETLVVRERSVLLIGDSMGEGTEPYFPGAMRGWQVDQNVARSRHVSEGISILRNRGGLPAVIVMSLGGNDDPAAVGTFKHYVDSAREIAGKTRCIVWPNVVVPPRNGVSFAGYNRVLDQTARKHDNLRVHDWVRIVNEHRYWLADDGVHVNATGYQYRARAIARQVERC